MNFTQSFITLFISVSLLYLIAPLFLRFIKKRTSKNPHKESLINSIVVGIIYLIGGQIGIGYIILYSFIYYFISYAILKKVTICENCKKEIEDDWNFCNYCGHKLK